MTLVSYQMLTHRSGREEPFAHLELFGQREWGLVIHDEVHLLPAPVFRATARIQARRRLGLTATLVREDGAEPLVFSLIGPKRYDAARRELEAGGWIARAECMEVRVPMAAEERMRYALADRRAAAPAFQTALEKTRRVLPTPRNRHRRERTEPRVMRSASAVTEARVRSATGVWARQTRPGVGGNEALEFDSRRHYTQAPGGAPRGTIRTPPGRSSTARPRPSQSPRAMRCRTICTISTSGSHASQTCPRSRSSRARATADACFGVPRRRRVTR